MADEKSIFEFIKLVAPGTQIRIVIDDIVRSNLGALIVVDSDKTSEIYEGGFRVNCRFSAQRLFELCKMDGAVILSSDLKRILYANVLLAPDIAIATKETGMRHMAAERTARQANTFVIAISERKNKTTLFYKTAKYFLRGSEEILNDVSASLQVLERERDSFDELLEKLSLLEISGMVSVGDVCKLLQRAEIIIKISERMKVNFIELGKEGGVINMRYKSLIKGVVKREEVILRDYLDINLRRAKTVLDNLTFEGLLELDAIARLLFEKNLEDSLEARGYRFLSKVNLSPEEASQIVQKFGDLSKILSLGSEELEKVVGGRAESLKDDMDSLREQILEGKVVF